VMNLGDAFDDAHTEEEETQKKMLGVANNIIDELKDDLNYMRQNAVDPDVTQAVNGAGQLLDRLRVDIQYGRYAMTARSEGGVKSEIQGLEQVRTVNEVKDNYIRESHSTTEDLEAAFAENRRDSRDARLSAIDDDFVTKMVDAVKEDPYAARENILDAFDPANDNYLPKERELGSMTLRVWRSAHREPVNKLLLERKESRWRLGEVPDDQALHQALWLRVVARLYTAGEGAADGSGGGAGAADGNNMLRPGHRTWDYM